jgi:hypothetical protein
MLMFNTSITGVYTLGLGLTVTFMYIVEIRKLTQYLASVLMMV